MRTKRTSSFRPGFSIVELLTVMSVIAILIALLVPALNMVKDYSKEIQQKSQFHSMEAALHMFNTDFGMYPPSNDNLDVYDNTNSTSTLPYTGANKLAEALVGRDMLGFHPNSDFTSDGTNIVIDNLGNTITPDIYHANSNVANWETAEENIDARKGPYIELENANAFQMQDVWATADLGTFDETVPVLCDVYAKKRSSGVKTGMPVLYYRARSGMTFQDHTDTDEIADDIYYYPDNYNLMALGLPENSAMTHPLADSAQGADPTGQGTPNVSSTNDWQDFESMILNKNVATVKRPYRAGSYILISAGKDGLYGTSDDITNFTREQ